MSRSADPSSGPPPLPQLQQLRVRQLAALEAAHRQVESALEEVKASTEEGRLDLAKFTAARLRVGQSDVARRQLVRRICSALLPATSPAEANAIRELQRCGAEHARRASELIGRWTPEAMAIDWDSFRLASYLLREQVRTALAAEKRILYPLLGSAA